MAGREATTINCLHPNQKTWTVKVIVVQSGSKTAYKSTRGTDGKIWKPIVVDETGTEVQLLMFDETVEKFQDLLKWGVMYEITNGTVKPINKNYQSVHPQIELQLQSSTEIIEQHASFVVKHINHNFIAFQDVSKFAGSQNQIDVIGILKKVKQSYPIKKRNGEVTSKREILLLNEKVNLLTINLWGDMAINEGSIMEKMLDEQPIIAISRLSVKYFGGELQLSNSTLTTIQLNPECPNATQLSTWLTQSKEAKKVDKILVTRKFNEAKGVKIEEFIEKPETFQENQMYFFPATINEILNKQEPYYHGCKRCNKAVYMDKEKPQCIESGINDTVPRYNIKLELIGANCDLINIVLFDEIAKEFIGCPIEEYINSISRKKEESKYYRRLVGCRYKKYNFLIKYKESKQFSNQKISLIAEAFQKIDEDEIEPMKECPILIADDEPIINLKRKKTSKVKGKPLNSMPMKKIKVERP